MTTSIGCDPQCGWIHFRAFAPKGVLIRAHINKSTKQQVQEELFKIGGRFHVAHIIRNTVGHGKQLLFGLYRKSPLRINYNIGTNTCLMLALAIALYLKDNRKTQFERHD